jgi:hypothetical protein
MADAAGGLPPGLPPGFPGIPGMPGAPSLPPGAYASTGTGKQHLSTMQLEMKAQEVPDSPTLNKWREQWNSKFPKNQQFTEQKFQQFIGGLFKFLQYLIKQEKTEAETANQDLKKSETDSD